MELGAPRLHLVAELCQPTGGELAQRRLLRLCVPMNALDFGAEAPGDGVPGEFFEEVQDLLAGVPIAAHPSDELIAFRVSTAEGLEQFPQTLGPFFGELGIGQNPRLTGDAPCRARGDLRCCSVNPLALQPGDQGLGSYGSQVQFLAAGKFYTTSNRLLVS